MFSAQDKTLEETRYYRIKNSANNFKHMPEYVANEWRCECGEPDLQAHLQECRSYLHLQEGLDLRIDKDLVKFYQLVIKERTEGE